MEKRFDTNELFPLSALSTSMRKATMAGINSTKPIATPVS